MPEDILTGVLQRFSLVTIIKPFILVMLAFYGIFALVIIRQVGLMTGFLGTKTTSTIKVLAWGHLGVTVAIFIWLLLFI